MVDFKIGTIVLGAVIGIIIIVNIILLIYSKITYTALKHAYNNSAHCKYDKTGSPNCAGPNCKDAQKKCDAPYDENMNKTSALTQIETGREIWKPPPVQSWDDIEHIARYSANLISSLERTPQGKVRGWHHQDIFQSIKYGPPRHPLGKIFYDNDSTNNTPIFIVIRGTASGGHEWKEDFKLNQVQSPEFARMGNIHQGFSEIFSDIVGPITEIINKISSKTIVVTGHSLGAALSILTSVYLRNYIHDSPKVLCLSFACPRIGNPEFANTVDNMLNDNFQIYRFRNTDDLVTNTPLVIEPRFKGKKPWIYKDIGKEFYYSDNWNSYVWNHKLNNYIQAMYPPAKYKLMLP